MRPGIEGTTVQTRWAVASARARATSVIERFEVAAQDQVGELTVAGCRPQACKFAGVIAPWLVAGEQQTVMADSASFEGATALA